MDNYEIIRKSQNSKVIAMLSGGKDSVASIILLKKNGIDVTAIHFVHKWGSLIPTEEAKRICKEYDIPLIIRDYASEFCNAVNGYTGGRPCLLCKKQMYKVLLKYLNEGQYGWLCIGDNSNDRTTIARIRQFIQEGHSDDSLVCSEYFGSEMGIVLPKGMKVIRPVINMSAKDIEEFLLKEDITIQRINSTGDKYFEYHREGCPIQFADIGVKLNEKLYSDLKLYNDAITEFARKKGILAAIHMPSTFIITIPRGYENEAASYLKSKGLNIENVVNSEEIKYDKTLFAIVYEVNQNLLHTQAYEKIFRRLLERLELFGTNINIRKYDCTVICNYSDADTAFDLVFDFDNEKAEISYSYCEDSKCRKDKNVFDNLILELFRTRKYKFTISE